MLIVTRKYATAILKNTLIDDRYFTNEFKDLGIVLQRYRFFVFVQMEENCKSFLVFERGSCYKWKITVSFSGKAIDLSATTFE